MFFAISILGFLQTGNVLVLSRNSREAALEGASGQVY